MPLCTEWGYETSSRKWNRGHNGLHQLGQPVAPSIPFPRRRFISPVCIHYQSTYLAKEVPSSFPCPPCRYNNSKVKSATSTLQTCSQKGTYGGCRLRYTMECFLCTSLACLGQSAQFSTEMWKKFPACLKFPALVQPGNLARLSTAISQFRKV